MTYRLAWSNAGAAHRSSMAKVDHLGDLAPSAADDCEVAAEPADVDAGGRLPKIGKIKMMTPTAKATNF